MFGKLDTRLLKYILIFQRYKVCIEFNFYQEIKDQLHRFDVIQRVRLVRCVHRNIERKYLPYSFENENILPTISLHINEVHDYVFCTLKLSNQYRINNSIV